MLEWWSIIRLVVSSRSFSDSLDDLISEICRLVPAVLCT